MENPLKKACPCFAHPLKVCSVPVPSGSKVRLAVAGSVCKDYSSMNQNKRLRQGPYAKYLIIWVRGLDWQALYIYIYRYTYLLGPCTRCSRDLTRRAEFSGRHRRPPPPPAGAVPHRPQAPRVISRRRYVHFCRKRFYTDLYPSNLHFKTLQGGINSMYKHIHSSFGNI